MNFIIWVLIFKKYIYKFYEGWNACSSCHGDNKKSRRFLVLPSVVSGNIYIVDVLSDAKSP